MPDPINSPFSGAIHRHRIHSFARAASLLVGALAFTAPVRASYHFMQIEQVIGGVAGNAAAQAIQLRARSASQNFVSEARLVARDARGENPIVLIDFEDDVPNASAGARILIATQAFVAMTDPPASPDFILANALPASYLAAGSLTFQNDAGTLIAWRVAWGGGGFTGPTSGSLTNDDDRNFGPPVGDSLPFAGLTALLFDGAFGDKSSTNKDDYVVTSVGAVFTNNAGDSFAVVGPGCADGADTDGDLLCDDLDNCTAEPNPDQADADSDDAGDACDECPNDPLKTAPGICGCGLPDSDADGDGVLDCLSDGGSDGGGDDPNDGAPDEPGDSSENGDPDDNVGASADDGSDSDDSPSAATPRVCGAGVIGFFPLMILGLVASQKWYAGVTAPDRKPLVKARGRD